MSMFMSWKKNKTKSNRQRLRLDCNIRPMIVRINRYVAMIVGKEGSVRTGHVDVFLGISEDTAMIRASCYRHIDGRH